MASSKPRLLVFAAVPALILVLPLSIYFVDSATASDKVARNITIAGVDVARQTEDEAIASVNRYASVLTDHVARIEVNGEIFELDPSDVGLTFNSSGAVNEALGLRRDGISDWLTAFTEDLDVPLTASLDLDMVENRLIEWEQNAIPNPAFEGSITISNGRVSHEYPRSGEAIDRDIAAALLLEALESGSDGVVTLPSARTEPKHTEADIDTGVKQARMIIERGVVLTNDEYGFEFHVKPSDLGRALEATVKHGDNPSIELSINSSVIALLVEAIREDLEVDPVDAHWVTVLVDDFEGFPGQYEIKDSLQEDIEDLPEDDTIEMVPGLHGATVDAADISAAVEAAALGDGTGELPLLKGAAPEFTTAMAEAFGDLYELAEFTTWMPGRNRVHNIQLMADFVDHAVVMPGEEFSINERVGRRTLEKGFKYDCAIVGGVLSCEEDPVNIGGGVSQFATTMFNTIYFSCLEFGPHRPHSIYFSRYPEGREATLGYPLPDVVFRNNTEAPVIIRTSYTPRTNTVTFFGNNGGITCDTERGPRTDHREPLVLYRADEEGTVPPGEEFVEREGSEGWSITNTRIFYDAAGNEFKRERFPWRYRGARTVILMHPCEEQVGGDGVCPFNVASIVGLSVAEATTTLTAAGLTVSVVAMPTSDQTEHGIVLSATPEGFLDTGAPITIHVGEWDGTTTPTP